MNYHRFKTLAIRGRWLKKQGADIEEIKQIIYTLGGSGGRGGLQLCEEWIMKPSSIVYCWTAYELYTTIDLLKGMPSLSYNDAIRWKLNM